MQRTSIEWTDYSVNPIKFRLHKTGKTVNMCTKVSPGCTNCYAEMITRRFWPKDDVEFKGYANQMLKHGEFEIMDHELENVLKLNESLEAGRRDPEENKVFWGDMFDLFHEEIPFDMLDKCFAVMALTPNLFHQVLTKRPDRMAEYLNNYADPYGERVQWPLPNVIGMTSVEDQERANERIPYLLRCNLAHRGLSCEPLLGPIDLDHIVLKESNAPENGKPDVTISALRGWHGGADQGRSKVDWIIVGGESGHNARPMHPEWVQSLRDQCVNTDVRFFFKQWGRYQPYEQFLANNPVDDVTYNPLVLDRDGSKHSNRFNIIEEKELGLEEMAPAGKKKAGRWLDGREWNQMPEVGHG